jgi:chemotaxis protein CheD
MIEVHQDRTVTVVQGECRISERPGDLLSTVLGSCVAVCLHDPKRRIGGMNHFLLPFGQESARDRPVRYGLFAMESLINDLMKAGAVKSRLEAKIFGGAKISADLRDIGRTNAVFAKEFLATEGIACIGESLGGTNARRVVFRPTTGQARMLLVASADVAPPVPAVRRPLPAAVELF